MQSTYKPLISVVVPVYGVEDRVKQFAESLFSQTLTDDVEFIFVNDASTDRSMQIINDILDGKFRHLRNQVKILNHKNNRGLPAARNTGIKQANGKYIINVDSDDFLAPNMLESLCKKCENENLDVAWCDWNIIKGNQEIKVTEPDYKKGSEALLHTLVGPLHYNVWNKLIKRNLFIKNAIEFPEGYSMGEYMTIMMVLACADRVGKVYGHLYNYVKYETGTITSNYAEPHIEALEHNVNRVSDFIKNKFPAMYDKEIAFMKLGMKSVFLVSGYNTRHFKAWKRLFKDANKYIGQNPQTLTRISFLEKCAKLNFFLPVALYNLLIVDFYNRLRYR